MIRHDWDWNCGGIPIGTRIFWTSLTLPDPLVGALVFLKPQPAALMLVILMVSDAAQNTWIIHRYGGKGWMVTDQWIFLIFVLFTISFVWRAAPGCDHP
ncbi:MAG TPA: hypothetical protein VME18_10855 [Acidobacteriaceae bacterium]|nr:hypothetical protein [Acidobacteriaceae bacterium]